VDIAHGEMVEKELDQMIERRSHQKDPEEEHDLWRASERAYFARRAEERCLERLTTTKARPPVWAACWVSSWLTTRPRSTETN
jgi:hypothetical protein